VWRLSYGRFDLLVVVRISLGMKDVKKIVESAGDLRNKPHAEAVWGWGISVVKPSKR
jgi:hypothetical protein